MITEKVTVGENTEYPLKGILTLPDDLSKKVPAVVMVHGSGASNMDEKVLKLTPFKDLAEGLCGYGIASLRYDKRTFVYARKMTKGVITAKEETIEDAIRAIEILKNDERIDPKRIYIIGHSMGAMLAPRIDAEGGNVSGLIMMAGSNKRLEDIMIRQLNQALKSNAFMRMIAKLELKIYGKKLDGLYQMSEEEAKNRKFAGGTTLYYFQEMGRKTAAEYLLENSKPTLIMQGGMDFQVLPEEDFEEFKQLLAERENTEFRLYPELDHCFVTGIYSDILKASKEYGLERHIPDEVIGDIADFINRA